MVPRCLPGLYPHLDPSGADPETGIYEQEVNEEVEVDEG